MDSRIEEDKQKSTFWLSLFSAIGVLAILGVILYLSQMENQQELLNPQGQTGIGGGPGEELSSPSPTPADTFSPTIDPQSYSL